jgi:hypothetical protein
VLDPAAWYRNVAWWTDGERVGIYFLKREAGSPWVPSYAGELDGDWFSVEPRRARKQK